ncbi:unnamed protein product, partial [Symbiodinium microadriaticum]
MFDPCVACGFVLKQCDVVCSMGREILEVEVSCTWEIVGRGRGVQVFVDWDIDYDRAARGIVNDAMLGGAEDTDGELGAQCLLEECGGILRWISLGSSLSSTASAGWMLWQRNVAPGRPGLRGHKCRGDLLK